MGADTTAGQKEWISFTNGMNGTLIVPATNLSDVERDIDFRGTRLSARGKTLIYLIEREKAF
jgi:hypothetical protein